MSLKFRNLEWLNHNSQRAYPLAASATKTDINEVFVLPDSFILGISLPVHSGLDVTPGRFYLKSIANYATGFAITIGYSGTEEVEVASALIARSSHTAGQVYGLGGVGDFADSRGHIVIGDLGDIDAQPAGLFEFTLSDGLLEPDSIKPNIRGIMSLRLQNGSELSDKLYGAQRLIAGRNVRLRLESNAIIIDAIEGEGLIDNCECTDTGTPIETINGVAPDSNGNLQLIGNDCIEFEAIDNGLIIRDLCSEPCCGCKELVAITEALEALRTKAATLENFFTSLESRVSGMDSAVLGSRLGDRSCNSEC